MSIFTHSSAQVQLTETKTHCQLEHEEQDIVYL